MLFIYIYTHCSQCTQYIYSLYVRNNNTLFFYIIYTCVFLYIYKAYFFLWGQGNWVQKVFLVIPMLFFPFFCSHFPTFLCPQNGKSSNSSPKSTKSSSFFSASSTAKQTQFIGRSIPFSRFFFVFRPSSDFM